MRLKTRQVFNVPGHGHEFTFTTYRRIKVFGDPECARIFLASLDRARELLKFQILASPWPPVFVNIGSLQLRAHPAPPKPRSSSSD